MEVKVLHSKLYLIIKIQYNKIYQIIELQLLVHQYVHNFYTLLAYLQMFNSLIISNLNNN